MISISQGNWTAVPHDVFDMVTKGKLKPNEVRIVMYVIRQSIGFNTKEGRRQWTLRSTHSEIAKAMLMAQTTVSTSIKNMVRKRILNKDGRRYQINANYGEWIVKEKISVKNLDNQESSSYMSGSSIENIENLDSKSASTSGNTRASRHLKETSKEIDKDNYLESIINLWNSLDKKLASGDSAVQLQARKVTPTLKSRITASLKYHDIEEIKQSIRNYYELLSLPSYRHRWRIYRWTLTQFLAPTEDRVTTFRSWKVVQENYCNPKSKWYE